jgi:anti-sigma factor RsiW
VVDPIASSNGGAGDHDQHDPELIASLLDRDLAPGDRAIAEVRIASCIACSALHEDLLALAAATADLTTPARSREFTLTPDVAASLARTAGGEPVPVAARLTGEMTDSRSTHEAHDRLLIASLVDRSPSDTDRALAEAQLAGCGDCAALYADLVALSAATRAMPIPKRPRDFTLTASDVQRLRVRGWRRLLAAIGSSRDVFSRPLAIGLTTLGLAGLLVATVPAYLPSLGGPTSLQTAEDAQRNLAAGAGEASGAGQESEAQGSEAPLAPESGPAIAASGPSAAPTGAPAPAGAASPEADAPDRLFEGGESSPIAGEPDGRGALDLFSDSLVEGEPAGPSPVVILASILLLAGLGLFGLRWTARRLGDG